MCVGKYIYIYSIYTHYTTLVQCVCVCLCVCVRWCKWQCVSVRNTVPYSVRSKVRAHTNIISHVWCWVQSISLQRWLESWPSHRSLPTSVTCWQAAASLWPPSPVPRPPPAPRPPSGPEHSILQRTSTLTRRRMKWGRQSCSERQRYSEGKWETKTLSWSC